MTNNISIWPEVSAPDVFVQNSPRVKKASRYLNESLKLITDNDLRNKVKSILFALHQPDCPWLILRERSAIRKAPALCSQLQTQLNYDSWWGAPAAADNSHHCYPGGWLMHNATNLHSLQMLIRTADEIRGIKIDVDPLLAGMLLHDSLKPRLLLWRDGKLMKVAEEYSHHVAALAEAYLRGMPNEVLRMLAGVHSGWWKNPTLVAEYLEQAAELIDRPELSRLSSTPPRTDFLPETWIMRQGEVSWYGVTRTAIQQVKLELRVVIEKLLPAEQHRCAEWWVLMHYDELELIRLLAQGKEIFNRTIKVLLCSDNQQCAS